MKNISLEFINTKLEKQYIQQHGTNLKKYFINSQILYLACLVSLAIYTVVLNFTMRAFALEVIGILINLITFYVGYKKQPSLIPHILLGNVLFIALYQLSYIPAFAQQTGANRTQFPHLYDPMQAYIIGFQVGILTISLVAAPNFYNSLIQMILICSLVFAMGATSGVTIFMFPLPFTSALTIYSAHYRQRIQRLNFLANRQQNCDDFVVRNSLDSAFIKIKLNDSDNKKFDLMLMQLKLDFTSFFRELKLIEDKKIDLELWLWNKAKQLVYSSSSSDMYKDLGSTVFEFKIFGKHQKLKVKVLTSFIHQIDLFLIFKEEQNPQDIKIDDKSSLQRHFRELFVKHKHLNIKLFRRLKKLERSFKNTPLYKIFYGIKLICFKELQIMYNKQLHYYPNTIRVEQLSISQLIQTINHSFQFLFSFNRMPPVISLASISSYVSTPQSVFIHMHLYICQILMKYSRRFQIIIILNQIEKIQILYVYKPRTKKTQDKQSYEKDLYALIAENQKMALNYLGTLVQYDQEALAELLSQDLLLRCEGKCIGIELFEANDQIDDKYF